LEKGKMTLDRMVKFAQSVVQTPGLSGEERPVVEIITREMQTLNFDKVWVDTNGSTVGMVEGTQSGSTLLLDAHCDTVGVAPGSIWQRDPYSGDVEDGFLHGRGSADMLGALAAMVYAVAGLDRNQLAGRVFVSATVMEEVMEGLSLATVMEQVKPDFVVIGEATNLNLNRGGRGRAEIHIETLGRPAHSSSSELGLNAVHEMVKIIRSIEGIKLPRHPLLGPAIMTLTDIISDPYPAHSAAAGLLMTAVCCLARLRRASYSLSLCCQRWERSISRHVSRKVFIPPIRAISYVGPSFSRPGNSRKAIPLCKLP
jgi:putative selenium metabolism hydrolase